MHFDRNDLIYNQNGHYVEECILPGTDTYVLRYVFQLAWI